MTRLTSPIVLFATLSLTATLFAQETPPPTAALRSPDAKAPTLKPGDPAPPLKLSGFAQGTPITEFQKEGVYVLECWATWCKPCIAMMPHLSKLSDEYKGKVTFLGIDVLERNPANSPSDATATLAVAQKFLEKYPNRMTYTVAADSPDGYIANNYLKAAAIRGIPASFIIANGKIAWFGHPESLSTVLPKVLAGNFDPIAYAAEETAKAAERKKLMAPYQDALGNGDFKGALAAIQKLEAEHPELAPDLQFPKFFSALQGDPAVAAELFKNAPKDKLTDMSQFIGETDNLPKDLYTQALTHLEAVAKTNPPPTGEGMPLYSSIARLHSHLGHTDQAVAFGQKALADAQASGAEKPVLDLLTQRLSELKSGSVKSN